MFLASNECCGTPVAKGSSIYRFKFNEQTYMTYLKSFFSPVTGGRILSAALATMASLALSSTASAITWIDEDNGDPLKRLTPSSPTYSSTFNILLDGYDPTTMVVTSAEAWFAFADGENDAAEYVRIYLGSPYSPFMGPIEVNGTHNNIPTSYDWRHGSLSGSLLVDLQDGIINYRVTVTSGDTYLKRAKLVAEGYEIPRRNVPDGGSTAVLLGLGLLGMGTIARRRVPASA